MSEYVVPAAAAVVLMLIWAAEGLVPLIAGRRDRTRHAARNVALGLSNGLLRAAVLPPLLLLITLGCERERVGLLHLLELPAWASLIGAVLLLDLWHYAWHVLWHKVPFFWRFHLVHHTDPEVDASTALRFHAGEILLSALTLLIAVPLLGVTMPQIAVFETILVSTAIFHHANVGMPERADRLLRLVIVTPRMHWVHHSRWEPQTDSNYSAIFSFWDRLFRTYVVADVRALELGLDGYSAEETQTLGGMLRTPLGPVKSGYGSPPPGAEGIAVPPTSRLASPSTHPARGRRLPLALAVVDRTPMAERAR